MIMMMENLATKITISNMMMMKSGRHKQVTAWRTIR